MAYRFKNSRTSWEPDNCQLPNCSWMALLPIRYIYTHNASFSSRCRIQLHSQKLTACSLLMKTASNNVVLPTLLNVVNNIVQHCYTRLRANSCSIILNNIVDNIDIFKPVFIRPEQVVHFSLFSTQLGTIEVLD